MLGDGDMDVELDTDKQKKRMAVDHNRVRTKRATNTESTPYLI